MHIHTRLLHRAAAACIERRPFFSNFFFEKKTIKSVLRRWRGKHVRRQATISKHNNTTKWKGKKIKLKNEIHCIPARTGPKKESHIKLKSDSKKIKSREKIVCWINDDMREKVWGERKIGDEFNMSHTDAGEKNIKKISGDVATMERLVSKGASVSC